MGTKVFRRTLTGEQLMPATARLTPESKIETWSCAIRAGNVPGPGRWNVHSPGRGEPTRRPVNLSTIMKTKRIIKRINGKPGRLILALCLCLAGRGRAQVVVSPPNYTVTTPGSQFEYQLNGVNTTSAMASGTDDSLNFSLNAGATYTFSVNTASIHPMDICTNATTTSHYTGATPQDIDSGTITLTIPPTNYPPTLYYICQIHAFYGIITVNPPQPPPTAKILHASVTTNIVLTFSGGTNTIQLVPQFSSNLANNVWLPVPHYTNTYTGTGTNNTSSFGRLDAICGPDVFIRISQTSN